MTQAVAIPESHLDLLTGAVTVALVTVMPDGDPQVTPVWCDYVDGYVRVNTARGRQKDENLSRDGRVAILAIDPTNAYRWLEVRGEVAESTEDGAEDHINSLSHLYMGKDYNFVPGETRVMYRILPTKVNQSRR
ncbi:MAG: PPOX class F420-dependent oxidoreductase [Chloroflexota bacterium]|nr:PPOX class F420-dependent oxidoreductase [Chloroflexota bacterium]